MTTAYWLADSEARVLGPVTIDVVRELALKGKLHDVRAVSRDGKTFVPLREMPELQAVLSAPPQVGEALKAQAQAAQQIRDWLQSIQGRATHEVFRVPPTASRDAWRAAFFSLVHRYVPSRLPPDASAELRIACEDAFLHLAERMVEIEKMFRAPSPAAVAPLVPPVSGPTPVPHAAPPEVSWRGGMIHVRLFMARGDARPFTADPDNTWRTDAFFVQSNEKVMVNTPAEVALSFEGHVTQLHASGRVVGVKTTFPVGFSVKLLDLSEDQRAMIRQWVARAIHR